MKREALTKEIEWLCFHAVGEGLLTKEQCIAVMDAIEENGLAAELELFVSVVVDNQICTDNDKLNRAAAMAKDEARMVGFPPKSIFGDGAEAAPQEQPPRQVQEKELPRRSSSAFRPVGATSSARPAGATPISGFKPAAQPQAEKPAEIKQAIFSGGPHTEAFRGSDGYEHGVCTDEWAQGWPRLADAEGLSPEAAVQLLNDFLHKARAANCSDIHISAGALPFVRRYKQVFLLPGQDVISVAASEALNLSPLSDEQRAHFDEFNDLDYGYNITSSDRYRTNVMRQRLGISGSYRVVDTKIKSIGELGFEMPEVIEKLTNFGQGLILVTGPAGSGKSTTLSALVEHLNKNRSDHVITVEDPIELVYEPKGCNITQRELNRHTRSFGNALRAALREDPDVIVIGEMRDLETIEMAIHSSETGHLVIGTLHTSSACDTMNRVLDVFPYGQQAQIRAMVAESLKGIICQQLLPNKDGDGVCLAYEILLGNLAVSNLIREGKTFQLYSTIQTSKHLGMITMEQSHFNLFMAGKRSFEQSKPYIKNQDLLRQMQAKEASGMGPVATDAGTASEAAPTPEPPKKKGWFGFGNK